MHLPPSQDAEGLPELVAEINITPLTDVFLVLLIIFMVSSTAMIDAARQGQLNLSLPAAQASTQGQQSASTLVVGVLEDGRTFVGGKAVELSEVDALLRAAYRQDPNTVVIVDADGAVAHRHVVAVIDRVKAAGFANVAIGAQTAEP